MKPLIIIVSLVLISCSSAKFKDVTISQVYPFNDGFYIIAESNEEHFENVMYLMYYNSEFIPTEHLRLGIGHFFIDTITNSEISITQFLINNSSHDLNANDLNFCDKRIVNKIPVIDCYSIGAYYYISAYEILNDHVVFITHDRRITYPIRKI